VSARDDLVLHLERTFRAPRAAVYRALTDPAELSRWWGPKGFTTPSTDFDPRAGRGYRIAMQPPEADLFHVFGEIRQIEPPTRLAYTFCWDPPHPDDRETLVTLTLEDRGETTDVRLRHGEFATEERHKLHEAGWSESFDRLEQLLRDEPEEPGHTSSVRRASSARRSATR
jgi:uncharacterized protein YndB with AHSA1/START domain